MSRGMHSRLGVCSINRKGILSNRSEKSIWYLCWTFVSFCLMLYPLSAFMDGYFVFIKHYYHIYLGFPEKRCHYIYLENCMIALCFVKWAWFPQSGGCFRIWFLGLFNAVFFFHWCHDLISIWDGILYVLNDVIIEIWVCLRSDVIISIWKNFMIVVETLVVKPIS